MHDDEIDDLTRVIILEFDRLNKERFDGLLPRYEIFLSGYAARTHGRINLSKRKIMLSLNLYEQHGWDALAMTLLHEMTHALIHELGGRPSHNKRFWAEYEKRGGVRDRIEVQPKSCYVYACPTCESEFRRMRRIKRPWLHSCPKCDRKYNLRHRLYLKLDKS